MSEQTAAATREQMMADFQIVTSDDPGKIQRAVEKTGAKASDADKSGDDSADDSALDADGNPVDATAESGSDSETDVEETVEGEDADDDDEAIDDKDEQAAAEKAGKHGKPKSGISKKFAKFTRELSAAERRAEAAEKSALELKTRLEALEKSSKPETKDEKKVSDAAEKVEKFVAKPQPREDDKDDKGNPLYPTFGDYIAANSKWTKEAVEEAQTHAEKVAAKTVADSVAKLKSDWIKEQADKQAAQESQKILDAYNGRKAKLRAKNPEEFDKYVTNKQLKITEAMGRVILTHDLGPDMAMYLGRHPEETAKIVDMTVEQQLMAMGRIETILTPRKSSKSSKTTDPSTDSSKTNKTETTNVVVKGDKDEPLPRGGRTGGRGSAGKLTYARAQEMPFDEYAAKRRSKELV